MPTGAWTPLWFVKVRSRSRIKDAVRSHSAIEQRIAVEGWAERQGQALTTPILVLRTRAGYRPDQDTWLCEHIRGARSDGTTLVMDDVFRFVDGCDVHDAQQIMTGLLALEPPIFSVRHEARLQGVAPATYRHEMERRIREFRIRSERAKRAAADPENFQPAPSLKARRKAIWVRQRVAEHNARRLAEEVERARASLPAGKRENFSAIARALNDAAIAPPSGAGMWQGITVKRVLERAGQSKGE